MKLMKQLVCVTYFKTQKWCDINTSEVWNYDMMYFSSTEMGLASAVGSADMLESIIEHYILMKQLQLLVAKSWFLFRNAKNFANVALFGERLSVSNYAEKWKNACTVIYSILNSTAPHRTANAEL